MSLSIIAEYIAYLLWVLGLAETLLVTVFKPAILKPIRTTLEGWHPNAYLVALKISLIVCGILTAGPYLHNLDVFTILNRDAPVYVGSFGIQYSPWWGTMVSILAMTFFGAKIHDHVIPLLEGLGVSLPDIGDAPDA